MWRVDVCVSKSVNRVRALVVRQQEQDIGASGLGGHAIPADADQQCRTDEKEDSKAIEGNCFHRGGRAWWMFRSKPLYYVGQGT